jgi:hypothetical protein
MTSTTFDTLQYAKKLKQAGFTEQQAEIQAEALADFIENTLASKCDIHDLKRDIKELELRLILKLSGIMGAMITLSTTFLALLKVFG